MCLSALSGGAAGGGNLIWSCYLLSKLQFRVFVETRFCFLAHFRNRHPDKSRIRDSELREAAKPGSHENAELQFGQQIATPNEISASRRAARKLKKQHYFMWKSVVRRLVQGSSRARNRKMIHFRTSENVSFHTFGRRGGRRKSHLVLLFKVKMAIPRFRGNPVSASRAWENPVSVIYRDVGSSRARGSKTGFPRKRGNAI